MPSVVTSFHLGPLVFHFYGFGLATAAYVTYIYARRRLSRADFDCTPFARYTVALIVSGLLGARIAHVATNWSYYSGQPIRWLEVWQGGLASFGGIALALPVGFYLQRRWWPGSSVARFTDALIPALIAGWALGRVLGPQFMVSGGGHLTHQWFGLPYADQTGKRVPVPLIQGAEDATQWLCLLALQRRGVAKHGGVITGLGMMLWGVVRTVDERLLLGQQSHSGSLGVQAAGLVLAFAGAVVLMSSLKPRSTTPAHIGFELNSLETLE